MSDKDKKTAMELTESDNQYIRHLKGEPKITQADVEKAMRSGKINGNCFCCCEEFNSLSKYALIYVQLESDE